MGGDGRYVPQRIFDVLSELEADVVALQEVPLQGAHGNFLVELEHATGYHVAAGPLFERRGIEFGNAVLSRRAFERVAHLDLTVDTYEPRGAVDVHIDAGARAARCASSRPIWACVPAERREQVKRLLAAVEDESPQPTMLMGDLNEWYLWGRPLRWLHAHFREKPEAPPTFPARRPVFALDRIWISPVGCLRRLRRHASPLARVASDHLPLDRRGRRLTRRQADADASTWRAQTRSRSPSTPCASAQWSQQNIRPSFSSPWPMMRTPQCSHDGASAWIAHSKLSKTCVFPAITTWNVLSYSLPQPWHFGIVPPVRAMSGGGHRARWYFRHRSQRGLCAGAPCGRREWAPGRRESKQGRRESKQGAPQPAAPEV